MEKIIGLIDAPFTPFYTNGDVNLEPIEALCQDASEERSEGCVYQWFIRRGLYVDHRGENAPC